MPEPEPLSATLRRLHRDATEWTERPPDLRNVERALDALPALADLVEETEAEYAGHREGCTCTTHEILAALRERMGAKP